MTKYILLMRHGEHETKGSSDTPVRRLTDRGRKETAEVTKVLASMLKELKDDKDLSISIGAIWRAETQEAAKTAEVVTKTLGSLAKCTPKPIPALAPLKFNPYLNTKTHVDLAKELKELVTLQTNKNAVLVIGHQPLLGWIAGELTIKPIQSVIRKAFSWMIPGLGLKPIPIARSELLCLAFEKGSFGRQLRGYLRWVLSPHNEDAINDIKEKIKSKMEIAKLLSVFITTGLAFLLGSIVDKAKVDYLGDYIWALYFSAGLFLVGAALYLATMYAYDRLLMPTRFWEETPPKDPEKRPKWLVWRPPSSALWVLYQNMMRIWRYLFTGATCAVILGLLFLAYAVFKPKEPFVFVGISIAGAIVFAIYHRIFGPKLGTQD
jgi:phosphohistidine phosphatase SixA